MYYSRMLKSIAFSDANMGEPASIFYHYTTLQGLSGIKAQGAIMPSLCCNPSIHNHFLAGIDLKKTPAIFLTRMDPSNSKESIAFNNYR